MQASFYSSQNGRVQCHLCPHHCILKDGQTGLCRVRRNVHGSLQVETYGRLAAIHLDPIEKKPLYHFHPGSHILSIGTLGCNMRCKFCQNCDISQVGVNGTIPLEEYSVDHIVEVAHSMKDNIGIAFTYNEPAVSYEFMIDVAHASHLLGMKTVMITNGYIEVEPLRNLLPFIDAFNVDLKAFNDVFYRKLTNAHLEPVEQTLTLLHDAHKHFEITHLIIPGHNDSLEEFNLMLNWILHKLGKKTILHLSRYFPRYQFSKPATPDFVLQRFYEVACKKLDYVYLGNVNDQMPGRDTVCKHCNTILIKRTSRKIDTSNLTNEGHCVNCGNKESIII